MNKKKLLNVLIALTFTTVPSMSLAHEITPAEIEKAQDNIWAEAEYEYDYKGERVDESLRTAYIRRTYCDNNFSKCLINKREDGKFYITNMNTKEVTILEPEISTDFNYADRKYYKNYDIATAEVEKLEKKKKDAYNKNLHKRIKEEKFSTTNEQPMTINEEVNDIGMDMKISHMVVSPMVDKAITHNAELYPNLSVEWETMSVDKREEVAKKYLSIAGLCIPHNKMELATEKFVNFTPQEVSNLKESLTNMLINVKNNMSKSIT